jgi:hypothetical protein
MTMTKNLQLHVPSPCHEDWAAMKPEEKGRFCGSCSKTVVDFSLMSDREVLGYLAGVSGKVCGRFTEDQLQRELMPPPQRKNKAWVIWNLMLAGLLIASRSKGQSKPRPIVMGAPARIVTPARVVTPARMIMGKMAAQPVPLVTGEVAAKPLSVVIGDLAIAPETDTAIPAPHYKELPPVEVIGYGITGGVQIRIGATETISGDTIMSAATKSVVSQFISDSVAFLGIDKKTFALYPNPAGRGTVIKLSLNLNKTGRYTVGLYNAAGALVQDKAIELDTDSRVELFSLPGSLPGGLYFVKLSAPGLKKVYTQKLIVL